MADMTFNTPAGQVVDRSPYSADYQGADAGMKNGCVFTWEVVDILGFNLVIHNFMKVWIFLAMPDCHSLRLVLIFSIYY